MCPARCARAARSRCAWPQPAARPRCRCGAGAAARGGARPSRRCVHAARALRARVRAPRGCAAAARAGERRGPPAFVRARRGVRVRRSRRAWPVASSGCRKRG
ncbi:MAG: hypothetical protein D6776_11165 [Planctomycetota bacterium]|nr:MAG: hypothetical protein D6776_11165 [Planctomycetota bacterium]